MGGKFFNSQRLSIPQQVLKMKTLYRNFACELKRSAAVWTGEIRPSALSESYRVRIRYQLANAPKVSVLEPKLRRRADAEQIPHIYAEDSLCLYLPHSGEWHAGKFIAETIVPWTSLWLYFYEVWHATGEWRGGGIHPTGRRRRR